MTQHLSTEALFSALHARPGLIPVHLDKDTLEWLDLEQYHFYEGFFHQSVGLFSALKQNKTASFTTVIDILDDERILTDYIYPSGFIFHPGRCGSTLLAKALGRSPENMMVSEAQPLNAVWQYFVGERSGKPELSERNIRVFRNLVLAISRRREPAARHCVIKFTSFNILFFDLIHAAFPDVPAIFLHRPVADIVASWRKKAPGWLQQDPETRKMLTGGDGADLNAIATAFLLAAEGYSPDVLMPVPYENLHPENLPLILDHFNIYPDARRLQLMQDQFQYDSKGGLKRRPFNRPKE